jgi:hypothetical protein
VYSWILKSRVIGEGEFIAQHTHLIRASRSASGASSAVVLRECRCGRRLVSPSGARVLGMLGSAGNDDDREEDGTDLGSDDVDCWTWAIMQRD